MNVAKFCIFQFHQNYIMSTACEALQDDRKVPIIQSGERQWPQNHKNQDIQLIISGNNET